jgi:photosystem II stability/assembly factor-like uncharacterized protein
MKFKLSLRQHWPTLMVALCMLLIAGAPKALAQQVDMSLFSEMKARNIGPSAMSGRVTAIDAHHDNPNIIYVGTASGGLWKSTSGGINFTPIFDNEVVHSIGAISIYQKNPSVIWVGTGEGNPRNSLNHGYGVYRTLDGGKTWQMMGLEKTRNIHRIIVHPDDPNTVFVGAIGSPWGTQEERGVYKTTDGGKTWKKILYVDNKTGVGEMIMDPNNPNKLFVNMWEHRRWPWFFKSGGPSSGLYVTYDGGDNWKKLGPENGLPKGDLGRMGLAIPRINSNRVYALIESTKNALYVSNDGGDNFTMVNDKPEIGNRPFYYYEIHADPMNENKLYTLYSSVGMSEDGGRSFSILLPYSGVHPDHHAWYIHPTDPNLIYDGNDGGFNISRDGGKNWYFADGIPVGQFYHVNVDNDIPYNIYGGLQDNGSWYGPAYVWRVDGIRNSHWQELMFGDGFDVVPHPTDSRYGYAMSQGGNVARYDRETGHKRNIRPTPENRNQQLRFNWNAAIAQNPHDPNSIYYGSQYLHRSWDRGDTWEIISPDLTTNDPEKQKQGETGGLTIDATGAENHTTIIAIAPSPVNKDVIWVGTDDGNVQVTRDGGKTWTNTAAALQRAGMPRNAWIPQVQASRYNAGEVWVIANNYRMNDFSAYAFRSRDYGQTWERIADDNKVWGYALSVIQDPVEPNLVFLGTEYGLYVSFDNAKTWNKWEHGYPKAVSTYDMVIQEREADLVIGTFGRSFYVLDDIRPLRVFAKEGAAIKNKPIVAVQSPDAYQAQINQPLGERFPGNGMYAGENRRFGGVLSFIIHKPAQPKQGVKYDSVKVEIYSAANEKIRTLMTTPKEGVNRVYWNLDRRSVAQGGMMGGFGGGGRFVGGGEGGPGRFFEAGGGPALPGTYKVVYTYGDNTAETTITVHHDPRIPVKMENLVAKENFMKDLERLNSSVGQITAEMARANQLVDRIIAYARGVEGQQARELLRLGNDMKKRLEEVAEVYSGPRRESGQAASRSMEVTRAQVISAPRQYANSTFDAPGGTEMRLMNFAKEAANEVAVEMNKFFQSEWVDFRKKVEAININLFTDVKEFKID